MTQQATVEGFYSLLTSDQTAGSFYDDLSGRIYEMESFEEGALPHLLYMIVTDPPNEKFTGDDIEATIQLDLYGERRLGFEALGDIQTKVLSALQGADITISGHVGGVFQITEKGRRSIEGDALRITMEGLLQANT